MILERINTVKHTIMKVFLPQLILKMCLWIRSGEYRAGIINGGSQANGNPCFYASQRHEGSE
jgi:hypothetical protein